MKPETVIAIYRAHAGKESDLESLLARHVPLLREERLATDCKVIVLKSMVDSSYLEIFEWATATASSAAHDNPRVMGLWNRMSEVCDMIAPSDLKEVSTRFPHFERVVELCE